MQHCFAHSRIPVLALALSACAPAREITAPVEQIPQTPPVTIPTPSASSAFELLGGYRLNADYASEGLALVTDADGFTVGVIGGGHAHSYSLNVYELQTPIGAGSDAALYPILTPVRNWPVSTLFPRWIQGQNLRDVTAIRTANGYELAGIGRVYYNTAPRRTTQISVRALLANGTALGATREIAVDLPEQEFSGFIKHTTSSVDLTAIGGGAYDSGQGSVGGLSYATRDSSARWTRRLTPPSFGDITSPRLPRDTLYSCPDGASWVCIPPAGGVGVWSTERIGGGGVRIGNTILFIATLGYGDRRYDRQTYTFGDPALDRAVAYFFRQNDETGRVEFVAYDRWPTAAIGEPVIGVAVGRLRGVSGTLLFVAKANAWEAGLYRSSPVLQVFRVR